MEEFSIEEALAIAKRNDPGPDVPSVSRTLIKALEEARNNIERRPDDIIVPYTLWEEMDKVGLEWKARAEKAEADIEFWNNRRETLLKVLDMLEHIRPLVLSLEVLKDVRDRKQ